MKLFQASAATRPKPAVANVSICEMSSILNFFDLLRFSLAQANYSIKGKLELTLFGNYAVIVLCLFQNTLSQTKSSKT